ncbi:MAG: hypothetical protein H6R21_2489 [Proteobacteria bacterium]|nr:hypothetical protein [Pseudomonadota bacterium]
MASTTSTNASTGVTTTSAQDKERLWSLAGQYKQGPIAIGVGYEKHEKFYAGGGDESGWHVGGSYTFGNFTLGGQWVSMEADTAPGATAEVDTWHVGVEWKIAGPHALHFGYTKADDMEGTLGAIMGTGATAARPAVGGPGATAALQRATSADMFQIRYLYSLSKRTVASVGYVALKNDDGASYDLGGCRQHSAPLLKTKASSPQQHAELKTGASAPVFLWVIADRAGVPVIREWCCRNRPPIQRQRSASRGLATGCVAASPATERADDHQSGRPLWMRWAISCWNSGGP